MKNLLEKATDDTLFGLCIDNGADLEEINEVVLFLNEQEFHVSGDAPYQGCFGSYDVSAGKAKALYQQSARMQGALDKFNTRLSQAIKANEHIISVGIGLENIDMQLFSRARGIAFLEKL